LDGRILTWNRGAEKLYGYRAEEAIGHSILILLDPEFHDQCRRISEALIRGRTFPRFECRATRQSGEGIVVSVSVSLVRNAAGEATGSAAIIRDITAARHAQWAVRDNEARYRRALESGPDGIGIITLDSRILYANETLCRMLGYSSEELYAIGWWNIIHPEDREVLSQMYQQMPVGQQAILESEKRYVHKLGHTVSASLRVTRIDFEDSCEFVVYVSETGNIAEGAFCAAGTFER
jgi:PAS domain S-box-containing protein